MKRELRGISVQELRAQLSVLQEKALAAETAMTENARAKRNNEDERVKIAEDYFVKLKARTRARAALEDVREALARMETRPANEAEELAAIVAARKAAYKGEGGGW